MSSYKEHIIDEIRRLVEPVLEEQGLELVEVQFRQENIGWVLRIVIFKQQGVTIDDCTLVSKEVSHLLDVEDLIAQKYHLEVSSPGLDRPLKTERDFLRNRGEKVRVTVENEGGAETVTGRIEDVREAALHLAGEKDEWTIPLESIRKARLVIEF